MGMSSLTSSPVWPPPCTPVTYSSLGTSAKDKILRISGLILRSTVCLSFGAAPLSAQPAGEQVDERGTRAKGNDMERPHDRGRAF